MDNNNLKTISNVIYILMMVIVTGISPVLLLLYYISKMVLFACRQRMAFPMDIDKNIIA